MCIVRLSNELFEAHGRVNYGWRSIVVGIRPQSIRERRVDLCEETDGLFTLLVKKI